MGLGGRMMGLAWVLDEADSGAQGTWGAQVSTPSGSSSLARPLICVARPAQQRPRVPPRKNLPLKAQEGAQVSASPQAGQSSPRLSTQQAGLPSGAHQGTRLLGGTKVLGWAQGSQWGAGSC